MLSLTVGEGWWIDESGKIWRKEKAATLAAARHAVALAPGYAPGQFALGLAYRKCADTEPDAPERARAAILKAAGGSGALIGAATDALKPTKTP